MQMIPIPLGAKTFRLQEYIPIKACSVKEELASLDSMEITQLNLLLNHLNASQTTISLLTQPLAHYKTVPIYVVAQRIVKCSATTKMTKPVS